MLNFPNKSYEQLHKDLKKVSIGEDVILIYDIKKIPVFVTPYSCNYTLLTFCKKGYAKGTYNMRDVVVKSGEICVIPNNQFVTYSEVSDDFAATVMLISQEFGDKMKTKRPVKLLLNLYHYPILAPVEESWRVIDKAIELLKEVMYNDLIHDKNDIALDIFNIIFKAVYENKLYISKTGIVKSRTEHLFEAFIDEIKRHYKESREVSYYAQRLCITSNYLNRVCQNLFGASALTVINRYILLRAEFLLVSDNQRSVRGISEELGFPNQSFFGKWFKKYSGMSPLQYRMSNQNSEKINQ